MEATIRNLRSGVSPAGELSLIELHAVKARMRGAATLAHLWDAVAPAQCADAHAAAAVPISSACPLSVAAMLVFMVSQGPRCALCGRNCTWQAPLTHGRHASAVTCNLLPPILRGCALMDAAARCDATGFEAVYGARRRELEAAAGELRDGTIATALDTALLSSAVALDADGDARRAAFLIRLHTLIPSLATQPRNRRQLCLHGDGLHTPLLRSSYAWPPRAIAAALHFAVDCDSVATFAAAATILQSVPLTSPWDVRLGMVQASLLHAAARAGRARVVAWMVETPEGRACVAALPTNGNCPRTRRDAAVEACRSGSVATVDVFVREARRVGRTPLPSDCIAAAVACGHRHIADFVLKEGMGDRSVRAVQLALRAAVHTRDASTVTWLVQRLDVRLLDDALAEAVTVGVLPTLVALVDAGAAPGRWRGANGETLLHVAARARATSCARWLLDGGHVPVDAACARGQTALNVAVLCRSTGIVNLLRHRGADVATVDVSSTYHPPRIRNIIAAQRRRDAQQAVGA